MGIMNKQKIGIVTNAQFILAPESANTQGVCNIVFYAVSIQCVLHNEETKFIPEHCRVLYVFGIQILLVLHV